MLLSSELGTLSCFVCFNQLPVQQSNYRIGTHRLEDKPLMDGIKARAAAGSLMSAIKRAYLEKASRRADKFC